MNKYDVAAYVWPAYSNNPQTKRFWLGNMGEWESVVSAVPRFAGHRQPRIPQWGYVNEADPRVMEMQIDTAVEYGVNVFIYDWYYYNHDFFMEKCLREGFLRARNIDKIKFYIMWANHEVTGLWSKEWASHGGLNEVLWDSVVDAGDYARITDRLVNEYFLHPSYYRIENKPVFMIYDLGKFVKSFGGLENARAALEQLRRKAVEKGLEGVHLQCTLRYGELTFNPDGISTIGTQKDWVEFLGFDSVTYYQYIHMNPFSDKEPYSQFADECLEIEQNIIRSYKVPFVPHVSVGWDNNSRFLEGVYRNIISGSTPEAFERACRKTVELFEKFPSLPKLVTINSWNEWTEGSYIQPDEEYGYRYLEAIKRVFTE